MKERVLVVAVHPDDETLGCGGALLRHKSEGKAVDCLLVTSALEAHGFPRQQIAVDEKQFEAVVKAYRFDGVHRLGIPTTKVDTVPAAELISKISAVVERVKPSILYLPFHQDVHSDHRKTFEAAFSCVKTFRYPFIKRVLMMETLSETDFAPALSQNMFIPNVFIDISKFMEEKLRIMKLYKTELKKHPFPRSVDNIRSLARLRGAMAGCSYAESFMLLKEIQ